MILLSVQQVLKNCMAARVLIILKAARAMIILLAIIPAKQEQILSTAAQVMILSGAVMAQMYLYSAQAKMLSKITVQKIKFISAITITHIQSAVTMLYSNRVQIL